MSIDSVCTHTIKHMYIQGETLQVTTSKGILLESYPTSLITPSEIRQRRLKKQPFCLIKHKGKFFIADVPVSFSTSQIKVTHKCRDCAHCNAKPTSSGGCSKVRSYNKYLEDYPYINFGVEVFGCDQVSFAVLGCSHFELDTRTSGKRLSFIELTRLKFELYSYLKEKASWDEFIYACENAKNKQVNS